MPDQPLPATPQATPTAKTIRHLSSLLALALVATAGTLAWKAQPWVRPSPLVLAPMIGGLDACLQGHALEGQAPPPADCTGPQGSASALIEATLQGLGNAPSPQLALGYTLKVPLLDFLRPDGDGWQVDTAAVQRVANTLAQENRPAVLYLFSNHFSSGAAIEARLAGDPDNLAQTQKGPLPVDTYYGHPLYPWSVARTDNELTRRRVQVIQALADQICRLPAEARSRLMGITVLGETHQLFPTFESGMGFTNNYLISDYSPRSIEGFRQFLVGQFGTLEQLNAALGSHFHQWSEVQPPRSDIRSTPLQNYWQHLDAYAHGVLPVSGWVAPESGAPFGQGQVLVYLDGHLQSRASIGLGRQDVLSALPQLRTADVGWRSDLDFSQWPRGIHQLDFYLQRTAHPLRHLGSRRIAIVDATQATPEPVPVAALPAAAEADAALRQHIDTPEELASFYFNPLARLWHRYRNQQVVSYLDYFTRQLHGSCLGQPTLYTHQLIPYGNPSWDANRYAVDASLQSQPGLAPGISLYGRTAYGPEFIRWLHSTGHTKFGVTEFHPLTPLDTRQLAGTLDRLHQHGARFVSMFLESRIDGKLTEHLRNEFSFDPDNPTSGSDVLFHSLETLLAHPDLLEQDIALKPTKTDPPRSKD
ncbi:MAG: hypothetical protein JOY84_17970 [Curvibacter sp.]|nr:hypothetical protein [Curvibacter sp.]